MASRNGQILQETAAAFYLQTNRAKAFGYRWKSQAIQETGYMLYICICYMEVVDTSYLYGYQTINKAASGNIMR